MTAIVDYGDLGVSPYARYPEDFADESKRGRLIVRDRLCPAGKSWHCQTVIHQTGISRDWLARLSESHRKGFLEGCEIEANGSAYLPRGCTRCLRVSGGES